MLTDSLEQIVHAEFISEPRSIRLTCSAESIMLHERLAREYPECYITSYSSIPVTGGGDIDNTVEWFRSSWRVNSEAYDTITTPVTSYTQDVDIGEVFIENVPDTDNITVTLFFDGEDQVANSFTFWVYLNGVDDYSSVGYLIDCFTRAGLIVEPATSTSLILKQADGACFTLDLNKLSFDPTL